MRKITIFFLSVLLMVLLAAPAYATTQYVFDEARLLSDTEREALENYAQTIGETYGCGIYMMTTADYQAYGWNADVFDVTWNIYHDRRLGWGEAREGILLLISMRHRDFSTYFYGENTEYAFDAYGQEQLEQYFLDNFGENDWYGGFYDYLAASEDFLRQAAAGDPVRESPAPLMVLFVAIALSISGIVTFVFWSQMRTAKLQSNASHYIKGGLQLTHQKDCFTHQTRSVRVIPKSSGSSGSRSHSGGGGSGRSGNF